jgi:mRNA-degrading endonuclease toxin of MazEF toxin-antitoxin module
MGANKKELMEGDAKRGSVIVLQRDAVSPYPGDPKHRMCVVVSADRINAGSKEVVIIPLSECKKHEVPMSNYADVYIPANTAGSGVPKVGSFIQTNKSTMLTKDDIFRVIGVLPENVLREVEKGLIFSFDLFEAAARMRSGGK